MKLLGQTEVCAFMGECPGHGDTLMAWSSELKHRRWKSAAELAADFGRIDVSGVPVVVFHLAPEWLRVETIINFRLGIILVTGLQLPAGTAQVFQTQGARHDH